MFRIRVDVKPIELTYEGGKNFITDISYVIGGAGAGKSYLCQSEVSKLLLSVNNSKVVYITDEETEESVTRKCCGHPHNDNLAVLSVKSLEEVITSVEGVIQTTPDLLVLDLGFVLKGRNLLDALLYELHKSGVRTLITQQLNRKESLSD